jgi:PAS domain S-box-containing protein
VTPPTTTTPIRLLLVEDNPRDARLIIEALRETSAEFHLQRVDHLESAIAQLGHAAIDVVLLDLGLPDSQGLETIERARRAAVDEAIIVMSDVDDDSITLQAIRAGAQDYVVKGRIEGRGLTRVIRYAIERKRMESTLRRSEERYRLLFDAGPHPVWVYETDTLRFLSVNGAAVRDYGYSREELLGMTIEQIRPSEDVATLRQYVARQRMGDSEPAGIWRQRKKDGTLINVEVTRSTLRFDGQHAALELAQDVTQRIELERRFHQAQKMEAVGRLAGWVAHDFNNMLTAIFGYADLLGEDLPLGSPGREDLQDIQTAATRAAALTRQLLAFSRQQVLQPVVLNINDVIENVEKMLRLLLGAGVELVTHLAPDLGNTNADPGQIEQVIVNLVGNARDAMPTGGKLTLETANVGLSGDYAEAHRPVVPGDYVMLAVSDSGVGIDETAKARLFEPFFTTKELGKGTGLGLATVYGIVQQSRGYIWVYSEPAHGATFKIYLPRVGAPVAPANTPAPGEGTPGGTETILLVENDELLRPLARALLIKLGYRVLDTANPADALTLARFHEGEIHLLVSDSLQLGRQLAAERPRMRVLYMSGYTDETIVRHGLLEPGKNFLQKPFTIAVLARTVRAVLDASLPEFPNPA